MNNPLIIMALQQEASSLFGDLPVVFCGVGKVNAAYALMNAISSKRPSHVINLGSAGSHRHPPHSIVNCTHFVQRDMDVTAMGFELYETPFESTSSPVLKNGQRYDMFTEGVCGTGDSFHTSGASEHFDVMDMEAYALSKICLKEDIPFSCIKYITDGADDEAANNWETTVLQSAKALRDAYEKMVKKSSGFAETYAA